VENEQLTEEVRTTDQEGKDTTVHMIATITANRGTITILTGEMEAATTIAHITTIMILAIIDLRVEIHSTSTNQNSKTTTATKTFISSRDRGAQM